MAKRAQKKNLLPPPRAIDYHQAAQLSALRALSLCFSGRSSSYFRLFSETFLEYVLQVFEADGAYLEFSSPSSREKVRLAIGCFEGREGWLKRLASGAKGAGRIDHLPALSGVKPLRKIGLNPKTSSLLSKPIRLENQPLGVLALGKLNTPSFFRQSDLEELEFFTHYFALASKKASAKKTREEAIKDFSENLEDGVYVIDRDVRAVVVNPKGKRLLGVYAVEDAIRGFYDDPVLLDIRGANGARLSPRQLPLARVFRGETFSAVEYLIRRPGEKGDVYLSLSGGFLQNKKGNVAEGILLAREITESKREERRLQSDLDVQKEKEKTRKAFLGHVSHELKTPLNVIVGYTSLLLAGNYGEFPERAREALARTNENAAILARMITDLLTLSQMEAMKSIVSICEVDIGVILKEVIKDARSLSKRRPVKLLLKIDPALPSIKSDPAKLREVFLNLFSNAVKYTPKGSIRIVAGDLPAERRVRVDVIDTGVGIREKDLFRLFEEFHRVDDPATRTIPGTGLGLSIVKMMVELLQGSVEVESVYGKGSTFTVFLPYTLRTGDFPTA